MTAFRLRAMAQVLPFLLAAPGLALAQAGPPTRVEAEAALNAPSPAPTAYTPQQIDQLVAPIALYPDGLLSQVLMAATYPDQIIAAAQWLQDPNNAALRGDALAAALQPLPWDPSVKALVPFPQVVAMLSQHIDWTQALGVAFAAQQPQVMAQVQHLRLLAMRTGRLRYLRHLVVREEEGAVVILPAQPDEIYVPVYNPVVVYGSYWPAPDYPPVYIPPPPGFVAETIMPGIQLSIGFGVVAPLWGWSRPNWHDHRIIVNRTDYTRITRNVSVGPGDTWRHRGPMTLVAPAEAARLTHARPEAALPKGTVAPARAAAVTALPQRAAAEPNRIRTAPPHAAAPAEHAAVQPEHGVAHPPPRAEEHAAVRPEHGVAHPAPPRAEEHAAVRPEHGVAHPPPRTEEHAAVRPGPAAHPPAAPRTEEHAAVRPGPAAHPPAAPHA
ncbi:MAG TPA: DUF3300 domain-containing protein, partial [Stellaceae bacterium]|nr:DUF3300 domain-containing protein [Stellaceae bacterium]